VALVGVREDSKRSHSACLGEISQNASRKKLLATLKKKKTEEQQKSINYFTDLFCWTITMPQQRAE
jgi:hypothetical protein